MEDGPGKRGQGTTSSNTKFGVKGGGWRKTKQSGKDRDESCNELSTGLIDV